MRGITAQKILAIALVLLGTFFLLVNNHVLPFGWRAIWPIIPLLIGLLLLRVYAVRKKTRQLFTGVLLAQFGLFMFLFSAGIIGWHAMETLWPVFPLMLGVSVLAVSGVVEHSAPAVVFGLFLAIFAGVSFMGENGVIRPRVWRPLVRIWPLVLVGAGVLVFLRAKREGEATRLAGDGTAPLHPEAPEPTSDPQT